MRVRPLPLPALLAALAAAAAGAAPPPAPVTLVLCAPGYPGSTAEAQPTLDAFAAAATKAAGWPAGALAAVYHESESAGLERLAAPDAALALVPLPFYLAHRRELALSPLAQAVPHGGAAAESWTLVAGKGRVKTAADLAGYRLVSLAAYAPAFVRAALAGWGSLPADVELVPSGAVLSALRKAASGERVALLLDREQAAALPTLPFAAELEVVARSRALPVSVLAAVGKRLPAASTADLVRALSGLAGSADGAAALAGMRLDGFVAADRDAIAGAERDVASAEP